MAPHSLGIGRVEKAIYLAVRVVEKLHLTNSKLIRFTVLGVLSYLCDGLVRQFQVVVEIHKLRHVPPFRRRSAKLVPRRPMAGKYTDSGLNAIEKFLAVSTAGGSFLCCHERTQVRLQVVETRFKAVGLVHVVSARLVTEGQPIGQYRYPVGFA